MSLAERLGVVRAAGPAAAHAVAVVAYNARVKAAERWRFI
jgi:hypothetical protein